MIRDERPNFARRDGQGSFLSLFALKGRKQAEPMKLPAGWKVDVDVANRRFRFCADVAVVSGSKDSTVKAIGDLCTPWIDFDDALAEVKRAGHNVTDERGRFWKRVKGWFGK